MVYYINTLTGETQWENPYNSKHEAREQQKTAFDTEDTGININIFQRVARRIDSENHANV